MKAQTISPMSAPVSFIPPDAELSGRTWAGHLKGEKMNAKPWHWPDHNIGKRESRRLREEHNATVNEHAELLEALERVLNPVNTHFITRGPLEGCGRVSLEVLDAARALIAKAKGQA